MYKSLCLYYQNHQSRTKKRERKKERIITLPPFIHKMLRFLSLSLPPFQCCQSKVWRRLMTVRHNSSGTFVNKSVVKSSLAKSVRLLLAPFWTAVGKSGNTAPLPSPPPPSPMFASGKQSPLSPPPPLACSHAHQKNMARERGGGRRKK